MSDRIELLPLTIQQQVVDDLTTGLRFTFWLADNSEPRIQVHGENLPFGNRDYQFDEHGWLIGMGTAMGTP